MALLLSRLFTKVLIVFGTLGLVFAWRVDLAIGTAYESAWVARGEDLRLPTHTWVGFHAAVSVASVLALAGAALLWRRRVRGAFFSDTLGRTSLVLGVLAFLLAAASAVLRVLAAEDWGWGQGTLTAVVVIDVLALATVAFLALATGNLVYDGLVTPLKGVFERQRMNLVVVLALAAALTVIGDTSGQAIDSIRSWSPIVFEAERTSWSWPGAARLTLGLAAALLLALVVYENGVRLTDVPPAMDDPERKLLILAWSLGFVGTIVGGLLWWLLPLGPGIFLAGVVFLLIAVLELPNLKGRERVSATVTEAEKNAPEWLAAAPLLALAGTCVAATVDAGLSGGVTGKVLIKGNLLVTAFPAVVLGALAVLLTSLLPTRNMNDDIKGRRNFWSVVIGIIVASLLVLVIGKTWLAALYGLVWLVFLAIYASRLFHPGVGGRIPPLPALAAPIALGGGLAALLGIHLDPLKTGRLLGVFALALLALALALYLLHHAVRATLRLRPPRLLAWFGFTQLPVLTLLLIWWIGVGVAQTQFGPKSLHDVRLIERKSVAVALTEEEEKAKSALERAFVRWKAAQNDLAGPSSQGPVPLVLVAAHGGGIRAAYWTVVALDCMVGVSAENVTPARLESKSEDVRSAARSVACSSRRRTEAEQRAAARRIFIASGVSGGAVGLYVYARQLLHYGRLDPNTSDWIDDRLGVDFAAPAVGWALFHDVPNRLLGLHPDTGAPCELEFRARHVCERQNRASVLEETFDAEWSKDKLPSTGALLRHSYDLRYSRDAEAGENARLLPLLVMNATLTGGNARAVVSAVDLGSWPRADADDPERGNDRLPLAGTVEALDALCETKDVRLSTAALLAARFPYVTPSGRIPGRCGSEGRLSPNDMDTMCGTAETKRCEGRFVDGGYSDNSGLFTVVAAWPSIRSMIVEHNIKARAANRREIAPMIVEIDNHYQASLDASVPSGGSAAEALIPPQTGFGSRKSIETYARAAAYRILPDSCTVTVSPSLHPGLIAPLGWELSRAARDDLRAGLIRPHPADKTGMRLVGRLRQIQARIAAPTERKVVIGADLRGCLPELGSEDQRAD